MPIPTPFHERIAALCTSMFYKDWAGYYSVRSFETCHEREYYAFRHATGMIDVTPLYKYDVSGPDAAAYLSRVMARNIAKLKPGRVTYCCWCDDEGKVIDDGTVTCLEENTYRVTAAEPSWSWFHRFTRGHRVEIEDVSGTVAALSLQGPTSRDLLQEATSGGLGKLRFFRMRRAKIGAADVIITRTGYTGDLGYEVWARNEDALVVWDALMACGKAYGIEPCGLDALDVTRVEAGFVMNGVDYFSAHHCLLDSRKSTPFELGLGGTVDLERDPFVGQEALLAEKRNGSAWSMAGVEMDWSGFEAICDQYGIPPHVPSGAWRGGIPIFNVAGNQIGYATSGAWSPTLKKNLALATIESAYGQPGTKIQMETTVEFNRHKTPATVMPLPFFNPPRKRS